jgi:hypothetical protein
MSGDSLHWGQGIQYFPRSRTRIKSSYQCFDVHASLSALGRGDFHTLRGGPVWANIQHPIIAGESCHVQAGLEFTRFLGTLVPVFPGLNVDDISPQAKTFPSTIN